MATACASRFAVLKLEDDDIEEVSNSDRTKVDPRNSQNTKSNKDLTTGKNSPGSTESKSKTKKKKKNPSDVSELHNLAFGNPKTQKPKVSRQNSHNPREKPSTEKQWEEWKKKDDRFVTEAYEQDLQQAILLSKLDYEEKKDFYDTAKKETDSSKAGNISQKKKKKAGNQKKDKQPTMSLEEFQNLLPSQIDSGNYSRGDCSADLINKEKSEQLVLNETDFFDKVEEDTENILTREQKQEAYKKTAPMFGEEVRNRQYQEEIKLRDQKIQELTEEVERLKEQLKAVKSRNKKLCNILGQAEMKEKAQIQVQVEHLTQVKDELTEQVTELHTSLEQERSKVHNLQTDLKKFQGNKRESRDSK